MVIRFVTWFWYRFQPVEGWMSLILLFGAVGCLIMAVLTVGWVSEDWVIIPATLVGLLLAVILAKRPISPWLAWGLITAYGFLIITLSLGNLWPPLRLLFGNWGALRFYWIENGSTFIDRIVGWVEPVFNGRRSNETIVFATIMGLTGWFLAAYLGWSAYRRHQPLLGLTLMGLVVALNGYYGVAAIEWAAAFVGFAVVTTAVFHFASLEWGWQERVVDYSTQIRSELAGYAAVVGFALLALSFMIPSFSVNKFAQAILAQPAVAEFEDAVDRAFGGVDLGRRGTIPPGMPGGAGVMPRAFLLSNAPELAEQVVMTAEVELLAGPEGTGPALARHWRGINYEIYTGRGWSLAEERRQVLEANKPIPLSPASRQMTLRENVNWRYDNRVVRYSLGLPSAINQPATLFWRGESDLVRISSRSEPQYQVISQVSAASPEELQQISRSDLDPELVERYTQLPEDFAPRVRALAFDVAGDQPNPYEQARALERFLRQYEYSLDIQAPPAGVDPVEYFLFDLQKGYCDYYASAMVVMARSLGLPARIATGFLAQPADDDGIQTIYQINAHSWVEINFGPYGWIEFEPTAGFLTLHDPQTLADLRQSQAQQEPEETTTNPIPNREKVQNFSWELVISLLLLLALAGFLIIRSRRRGVPRTGNEIVWAFGRLQEQADRLGFPAGGGQTPDEFSDALLSGLHQFGRRPRLEQAVRSIRRPVEKLTALFVRQRYSGHPVEEQQAAVGLWKQIRQPLWRLWLARRFSPPDDPADKSE